MRVLFPLVYIFTLKKNKVMSKYFEGNKMSFRGAHMDKSSMISEVEYNKERIQELDKKSKKFYEGRLVLNQIEAYKTRNALLRDAIANYEYES